MSAHAFTFSLYVGAPSFFRTDPFIRLSRLCQEYCEASYSIEIFDTREDLRGSIRAGVQDIPAVTVTMPGSPALHLGNLAKAEAFLKKHSVMKV